MTASTVSSTSEKLRTLIGVRIAKETDFGDPGLTVPDVLRLDGMFRFIFESLVGEQENITTRYQCHKRGVSTVRHGGKFNHDRKTAALYDSGRASMAIFPGAVKAHCAAVRP